MPVFTPINVNQAAVHNRDYIRSENEPDSTDTKPAAPEEPTTESE